MSFADSFRSNFGAGTCTKGDAYFRQGKVKVVTGHSTGLEAQVRGSGSRPYNVDFDWSDLTAGLRVECSCPHYDEGSFCKHIWATMRAADEAGVLENLPVKDGCELIHSYDEREEDDDEYGYEEDDSTLEFQRHGHRWKSNIVVGGKSAASATENSNPKRPSPSRHEPPWHQQLASLPAPKRRSDGGGGSSGSERPRQAWFVIDVGESAASGAVVLNLRYQETLKSGQWSKVKELRLRRDQLGQFDAADQRRLSLAMGNRLGDVNRYASYGHSIQFSYETTYQQIAHVELNPDAQQLLLPELAGGGRLAWTLGSAQPQEDARPLSWDGGEPWEFRLVVAADDKKKHWTVKGELRRTERATPLAEAVLLFSSGVVLFPETMARMAPVADWRWVSLLRQRGELIVPYADRMHLVSELWGGGGHAAAELPANLVVRVETPTPGGKLIVHGDDPKRRNSVYSRADDVFYADVNFEYPGGTVVAAVNPVGAFLDDEGNSVLLRDRAAEGMLLSDLVRHGVGRRQPRGYHTGPGTHELPRKRLGDVVQALVGAGWRVEAEGKLIRRPGEFKLNVASGVDWFDVSSSIDFDGVSADLPRLLAAIRGGKQYVELGDGTQGMLPQQWLDRFAPLAELAEVDGENIRFRSSQALLLDALLAEREGEIDITLDKHFCKVRDKLRSFAGVEPCNAPAGFQGELRPYQQAGLGWLRFLAEFGLGGCLADDMGLGKTIQVLAHLLGRRRKRAGVDRLPSLVVAPKSLVFNWQAEAARFAPKLNVLNYTGLERRDRAAEVAQADLVLTTYGTLRRDVEELQNQRFDYVILDEAQAIKNNQSISAKACRLLHADHRLVLTGTPVENHLGDLWSLFEFLNPGMLGRSTAFRDFTRAAGSGSVASMNGTAKNNDVAQDQRLHDDDSSQRQAIEAIRRGLAPFILRRTKEQVLADLPQKTEQTLRCELLPADRKRYNELRDHYRASLLTKVGSAGMSKTRMHVLEALLRLRQAACHGGLLDKKLVAKPSAKLDALLEQLTEILAEGHKALVFSQFTSLLSIVKRRLDADRIVYEYLDGKTRDRQARVERFQTDPACPLFLISLKAGGCGLNLTAADYVFLLDPWWNPAVEAQAIDRAHRIGQERPVFAYRLIAADTVEEKILELQKQKRDLADALISGEKSVLQSLSAEDLQLLLS